MIVFLSFEKTPKVAQVYASPASPSLPIRGDSRRCGRRRRTSLLFQESID